MTINREHFEAWLFSQPGDKKLDYLMGWRLAKPGCLLCNYFRDNFKFDFGIGDTYFRVIEGVLSTQYLLDEWLCSLLNKFMEPGRGKFTIAEAQAEYLKLFPDTVPALPVHDAGVAPEPVKV